jgi:hypothetical protein
MMQRNQRGKTVAKHYLMGLINNLGQFEIIGLELRTKEQATQAMRWQRSGGFKDCVVARVNLNGDKPSVTLLDKLGNPLALGLEGHPAQVTNSGYKAGAFEAFVADVWGAKA